MQDSSANPIGPNVAGTWYPADESALRAELDRLLRADPSEEERKVPIALIAPHAGFAYSGAVAGQAFRRLAGAPISRVILIGPSHYKGFAGAAVPAAGRYRTPLGVVEFDPAALDSLVRAGFQRSDGPFAREHCLEAEIPFLQQLAGAGLQLVPVLVGARSGTSDRAAAAAALRDCMDDTTALVVSSDFTHYGPRFGYVPFADDVEERLRTLDLGAIERIVDGDGPGLADYLHHTGATVCGRDAIDVLLRMLPAGTRGELIAYDTSGRMTGDWSHSVSYASLAFPRPGDSS